MKPARSFLSLLVLSGALAAQSTDPKLTIAPVGPLLEFSVAGPTAPFLGAVILSFSPAVSHYFQGLPPILTDFAVLGVGFADPDRNAYAVAIPEYLLPPGILMYVQGLAANEVSILSTPVVELVLDGSLPPEPAAH